MTCIKNITLFKTQVIRKTARVSAKVCLNKILHYPKNDGMAT
jgi:hypothetical protein